MENCAEFCARNHRISANGKTAFSKQIFRLDCGLNPLFPQAGTWIYDRAGWCPGDMTTTYDIELSDLITDNQLNMTYEIQNYQWNGQGSTPYYAIHSDLVTYGKPNFINDVAADEIITPSIKDYYGRMNPICNNPRVVIQNTGSTVLSSATITYGVKGQKKFTYEWEGTLKFLDKEEVILPPFSWGTWNNPADATFEFNVSNPNGTADEYNGNNSMNSHFNLPLRMDSIIIVRIGTNKKYRQNSWRIYNANGKIVAQRRPDQLSPEEIIRDTLTLPQGCYRLELTDNQKDGLQFFVNDKDDGVGSFGIRNLKDPAGETIYLEPNFGTKHVYSFTVGFDLNNDTTGYYTAVEEQIDKKYFEGFSISPNPSNGDFKLVFDLPTRQDIVLEIFTLTGQKLLTKDYKMVSFESTEINLQNLPEGIYFAKVKSKDGVISKKLIISRD